MIGVHARNIVVRRGDREVLRNVGFDIDAGRSVAVMGASGSGKTTLLLAVSRLISPARGEVLFDPPPARGSIGFAFQDGKLWEHLTCTGHLAAVLSAHRLTRSERKRRIEDTLDSMGILALKDRRPSQLSGGERSRLGLARALAVHPRLLLLDEPFTGLDRAIAVSVRDALNDALAESGATVMLATHTADDAFKLADELMLMRDGELIQHAGPSEIYDQPVDLDAARLLGTAFEYAGSLDGRRLVPTTGETYTARILRPTHLDARPEQSGCWSVASCTRTLSGWHLTLQAETHPAVIVASHAPIPVGKTIDLTLRDDNVCDYRVRHAAPSQSDDKGTPR